MAIDTAKVDELSDQLKALNQEIATKQDILDALKNKRKQLENEIRCVTSGRKKREK